MTHMRWYNLEWMNEWMRIYIPHISHIVSRRFTILIEWDRMSACKGASGHRGSFSWYRAQQATQVRDQLFGSKLACIVVEFLSTSGDSSLNVKCNWLEYCKTQECVLHEIIHCAGGNLTLHPWLTTLYSDVMVCCMLETFVAWYSPRVSRSCFDGTAEGVIDDAYLSTWGDGIRPLFEDRSAWDCPVNIASANVLSSTVFCLMISSRMSLDNAVFTAFEMAVDMVARRAFTSKETKPGLLVVGSATGGSIALSSENRQGSF